MAGTLVKVRFKLAWQNYRVGDEITPNGVLRDWLLANGYATLVGPDRAVSEPASPSRPVKFARAAAKKLGLLAA